MNDLAFLARLAAGVGAAVGTAWIVCRSFGGRIAPADTVSPLSDMRLVLDLAARLRDAGKPDAVKLCQQLIDEMLKPEAKS